MGDENNWRNEWIELYNGTNQDISLDGWSLKINDKRIYLKGNIDSFYLIKNKKDAGADLTASFNLNNNGAQLTLLDNSNNIIDALDFSSGWPAGDNLSKQTVERTASQEWQTSVMPRGTPGKTNSENTLAAAKQSDIQITKDISDNRNFGQVVLKGLSVSSFLGLIGLYLNLQKKNHNIDQTI